MKKKIIEYEVIRLLAMLAVVEGHSCYTAIGFTKYQLFMGGGN